MLVLVRWGGGRREGNTVSKIWIRFSRAARLAARVVGVRPAGHTPFMTRELIRSVADMAERTSAVSAFDRSRIRRVIRFAETTVGEAMIPVAEITGIDERTRTAKEVELVRRHGYNRLPLYRGNISNVVGVVTLTTLVAKARSGCRGRRGEPRGFRCPPNPPHESTQAARPGQNGLREARSPIRPGGRSTAGAGVR